MAAPPLLSPKSDLDAEGPPELRKKSPEDEPMDGDCRLPKLEEVPRSGDQEAVRAEAEVQRMLSAALSNNQRRLERAYLQKGRKENFGPSLPFRPSAPKVEAKEAEENGGGAAEEVVMRTSPVLPESILDLATVPDTRSVYRCAVCSFYDPSPEELRAHCLKMHPVPPASPGALPSDLPVRDAVEGARMGGGDLQGPQEAASRVSKAKMHRCKQCKFFAFTKEEFWAHARTHMKEEKILECPSCSFVTEYKHHLEYHIRNHIGSKPFKCDKCSYECVNKSMLNSHMKSHNNVYQYLCADCCYATKYCHSMKLHVNKYRHRPATILNHPDLANGSLGGALGHGGMEDRPMLAPPPPPVTCAALLPPASAAFNAAAAAAACVAAASIRDDVSPLDGSCRGLSLHMPPQPPPSAPVPPSAVTSSPSLWPPAFPSLLTAFTGAPYFPPASNMGPGPLMPPPMGSALLPPPQPVLMKADRGFFAARSSPDEAALAPLGKRPAEEGGMVGPEGSPDAKRPSPAAPDLSGDFPESAGAGGARGAPDQSYMECGHCDLFFRDHIMFDIHMGYHGYTNPFACNRCGYTAATKVEFFLHLMQKSH